MRLPPSIKPQSSVDDRIERCLQSLNRAPPRRFVLFRKVLVNTSQAQSRILPFSGNIQGICLTIGHESDLGGVICDRTAVKIRDMRSVCWFEGDVISEWIRGRLGMCD